MGKSKKKWSILLVLLLIVSLIVGCTDFLEDNSEEESIVSQELEGKQEDSSSLSKDGVYTDRDSVAEYIYIYGELPNNFITKSQAYELGWEPKKGNLWEISDKKSIGGDKFGNREGNLPMTDGRQYFECDINYDGRHRGAERIVYSNDGLIYYTDDHYKTFTLLYGDE